jgi:folate-dependent phosphoribosylglycinamide formyltransferase PurN
LADVKLAVITNHGSLYGKKILNHFHACRIPIQAAIVIHQPVTYFLKLFQFIHKRVGTFDSIYFTLRRLMFERHSDQITQWRGYPFIAHYEHFGIPIRYSRLTNSIQTQQILNALAPDVLILGQTGIVREPLLAIPRIGTLNAHPGILPLYRGIDCAKWAVFNDDFTNVGASVHWVDRGIDTGNLIMTRRYPFSGIESLESLDDHLYDQCTLMLAEAVGALGRGDPMAGTPQEKKYGKQYYKMPRKHESIARAKLDRHLKNL